MKTLGFVPELVPLVLTGEKTSTWRLFDDKNLTVGDEIEFIEKPAMRIFAKAKITSVIEKPFGKFTQTDLVGHEKFKTRQEMYSTYSGYYKQKVGPQTPVKIVRFHIVAQY